jgi:hypothetical protein
LTRTALAPLAVALVLRAAVMLACDGVVADVERYQKVGRHLLDVSWNPYETQRLYPYPPPWAAVEAGALWLERHGIGRFAVNVKLPVLLADLAMVAVFAQASALGMASSGAAWLYAFHPVSLLIGSAHGQFDAIPLVFLLAAVLLLERGRRDASALALAAGIASKSFPVLALPFLALAGGASAQAAVRYAVLALAPGAVMLAPFAAIDPVALRRELFGYGGIADFGWTGVLRGAEWLATGVLPRSEARFWPTAAAMSRELFLLAWAALVVAVGARRLKLPARRAVLLVLLAFSFCYGLQSAQYLLWVVPLALLRPDPAVAAHAAAASAALLGFYVFLAPGVLWPATLGGDSLGIAGRVWLFGSATTLAVVAAWLGGVLREAKTSLHGTGPRV